MGLTLECDTAVALNKERVHLIPIVSLERDDEPLSVRNLEQGRAQRGGVLRELEV